MLVSLIILGLCAAGLLVGNLWFFKKSGNYRGEILCLKNKLEKLEAKPIDNDYKAYAKVSSAGSTCLTAAEISISDLYLATDNDPDLGELDWKIQIKLLYHIQDAGGKDFGISRYYWGTFESLMQSFRELAKSFDGLDNGGFAYDFTVTLEKKNFNA